MKARLSIFWSWHKKAVIGFCIYYMLFLFVSVLGAVRGWALRLPMIALLLVLLLVSNGGGECHYARYRAVRRDPMLVEDMSAPQWDMEDIPFLATICLILPPLLWLVVDFLT